MPGLTPAEVTQWETGVGTSLKDPARRKLIDAVTAAEEAWDDFLQAPRDEATYRRCFGPGNVGLKGFTLDAVVDWALTRGVEGDTAEVPPNALLERAAVDAVTEATDKGLSGAARDEHVARKIVDVQRGLPEVQGKSPFCRVLYLHGNDSPLLEGSKVALAKAAQADSVHAMENENGGQLVFKGSPFYLQANHISSWPAWSEYQAANKAASRANRYSGLVERIGEVDEWFHTVALISWGLCARLILAYFKKHKLLLEKATDPDLLSIVSLVWEAEGRPAAPPHLKWTVATAKQQVAAGVPPRSMVPPSGAAPPATGGGTGGGTGATVEQLQAVVHTLSSRVGELTAVVRRIQGGEGGGEGGGGDGGGGGGRSRGGRGGGRGTDHELGPRCFRCQKHGHVGKYCPEFGDHVPSASSAGAGGGAAPPAIDG